MHVTSSWSIYSTIKMMHGPINIRFIYLIFLKYESLKLQEPQGLSSQSQLLRGLKHGSASVRRWDCGFESQWGMDVCCEYCVLYM